VDVYRARSEPAGNVAKVKGFQSAQSWYQDFTKVTVE
jgi:hypothetical protein